MYQLLLIIKNRFQVGEHKHPVTKMFINMLFMNDKIFFNIFELFTKLFHIIGKSVSNFKNRLPWKPIDNGKI